MALTTRSVSDVEIVTSGGSLDAAVSDALRRQLKDLLQRGRTRLVFDLRDVRFIDSSGLSVLVSVLKEAAAQGGGVVLLDPTPTVRSVLELTRLDRVMAIFQDEESAVKSFGEGEARSRVS